jgi:hypothetical protein
LKSAGNGLLYLEQRFDALKRKYAPKTPKEKKAEVREHLG